MQTTAIKNAIQSLNSSIRELREQQTLLRTHKKVINRYLAPINKAHAAGLVSYTPCVSASKRWDGEVTISITATVNDLPGLKDERLQNLLGKFIDADDIKTQDYPSFLNRDFSFTFKNGGVTVCILISAYVTNDSPTCKKVLKGVKSTVVETKEYELVCS